MNDEMYFPPGMVQQQGPSEAEQLRILALQFAIGAAAGPISTDELIANSDAIITYIKGA